MTDRTPIEEMTERELLAELLRQQTKSSRNGRILVIILAVIAAVGIIAAATVLPGAIRTIDETHKLIAHGEESLTEADTMISNMKTLYGGMEGLIGNLNGLVTDNTEVITDSLQKIDSIDIDSLNKSIQNLSDILEPLANFFHLLS